MQFPKFCSLTQTDVFLGPVAFFPYDTVCYREKHFVWVRGNMYFWTILYLHRALFIWASWNQTQRNQIVVKKQIKQSYQQVSIKCKLPDVQNTRMTDQVAIDFSFTSSWLGKWCWLKSNHRANRGRAGAIPHYFNIPRKSFLGDNKIPIAQVKDFNKTDVPVCPRRFSIPFNNCQKKIFLCVMNYTWIFTTAWILRLQSV